ncbi:uncharacterized protein LOC129580657 isoform X2 [Paramacrobiotus metropolitanus]|uniref:uncharacterized protein LOC129580657 isoform X2 n=1 Tax=Paramacrobiotus metropolitanus TaxID=2943436 RepID=UPI0024456815|nr:uncharacterized protein LOC129580657 isoform X2 [Paramacrobiotus metropolitanus]
MIFIPIFFPIVWLYVGVVFVYMPFHAISGVWLLLVRKWGTRIWLQIVDDSGVVDVVGYNQIQQQLFGHSAAAHQSGLIGIHDFSAMNKQFRVILKQAYTNIEGRSKETISITYMEEKKPDEIPGSAMDIVVTDDNTTVLQPESSKRSVGTPKKRNK